MTVDAVTTRASKKKVDKPASAQERLAVEMITQAQRQGLALTGSDGLLKQLTKTVLEAALSAEMTEHLGHAKHADGRWLRARARGVASAVAEAAQVALHGQLTAGVAQFLDLPEQAGGVAFALVPPPVQVLDVVVDQVRAIVPAGAGRRITKGRPARLFRAGPQTVLYPPLARPDPPTPNEEGR
jgi:hypothetical protein